MSFVITCAASHISVGLSFLENDEIFLMVSSPMHAGWLSVVDSEG